MATGLLNLVQCYNMVWDVKTKQMSSSVQKVELISVDKKSPGMKDPFEMLKCDEALTPSPECASCDVSMDYDDLPELQEVQTDLTTTQAVFQLPKGVSHQEYSMPSQTVHTSDSLDSASSDSGVDWLTELAHIATSPQSPLMQCTFHGRVSPVSVLATSKSLHSYARPPPSSSKNVPDFTKIHWKEDAAIRHEMVSSDEEATKMEKACSSSESGIFCTSSFSDDDDLGWCHTWPSTVWHCFIKGTRVRFHSGFNKEWQHVEEIANPEDDFDDDNFKGYGSDGLKLVSHEEIVSYGQSVLKLTFDPGTSECSWLTAECHLDHPFYVRDKGWSSFYPSLTVVQHGIPCREIKVGDVCLPPGHPDAINFDDSGVFDKFKSYDFTPMDFSAVYVLSSMARQRRASLSGSNSNSPDCDPSEDRKEFMPSGSSHLPYSSLCSKSVKSNSGTASTVNTSSNKCKRPMNAFMLFAKKYRVEYTQMYPGKDNRAISVILGDRWKKMKNEERRMYILEAKALAEEQKRLNPDCWKRKRSNSGSQQH